MVDKPRLFLPQNYSSLSACSVLRSHACSGLTPPGDGCGWRSGLNTISPWFTLQFCAEVAQDSVSWACIKWGVVKGGYIGTCFHGCLPQIGGQHLNICTSMGCNANQSMSTILPSRLEMSPSAVAQLGGENFHISQLQAEFCQATSSQQYPSGALCGALPRSKFQPG